MSKRKTEKKVENEKSTLVRFTKTKTKTMINGISKPCKDCRSVWGNVANKPAEIQQYWGSLGADIPKARELEKTQR